MSKLIPKRYTHYKQNICNIALFITASKWGEYHVSIKSKFNNFLMEYWYNCITIKEWKRNYCYRCLHRWINKQCGNYNPETKAESDLEETHGKLRWIEAENHIVNLTDLASAYGRWGAKVESPVQYRSLKGGSIHKGILENKTLLWGSSKETIHKQWERKTSHMSN